jgi:endonuclease YncB( thermonuclease family)
LELNMGRLPVLVLIALVAGCSFPPGGGTAGGVPRRDGRPPLANPRTGHDSFEREGDFVRCVGLGDGATIRVEWQGDVVEVAMIGVAAPGGERGKMGRSELEKLAAGKTVELVFPFGQPDWEGPGRLRAYVERDGRDVAEYLLARGLLIRKDDPAHPRLTRYRGLRTSGPTWEGDTYRQEAKKPTLFVSPFVEDD